MAALGKKGMMTPLSSLFPAEEAQKAAQQVQGAIAKKHKQLDNLQSFIDDNTNLINVVQRLPDELNHHIMVPFGKGAFFPGRLVHTNEFLVLLGEGYFAERTAKQTVEILKRRGKALESHVDALKAVVEDLKSEASFFDRTAAEAAEGLVEIREEYTDDEENYGKRGPNVPELNGGIGAFDDEEYSRMMSRFDELEKEELDAGNPKEDDEDGLDEDSNNLEIWDQKHSDCQSNGKEDSHTFFPATGGESKSNHMKSHLQPVDRDLPSFDKVEPERPAVKDYVQSASKSSIQSLLTPKSEMPKKDAGSRIPAAATNSLKAFTCSIVERSDNLPPLPDKVTAYQPSNSQSSKPVSRFKMQRRAA